MPMSQTIGASEKLPMYNAINNRNGYEIPYPLPKVIKSISGTAQPPPSVVLIDSIDKDNNSN